MPVALRLGRELLLLLHVHVLLLRWGDDEDDVARLGPGRELELDRAAVLEHRREKGPRRDALRELQRNRLRLLIRLRVRLWVRLWVRLRIRLRLHLRIDGLVAPQLLLRLRLWIAPLLLRVVLRALGYGVHGLGRVYGLGVRGLLRSLPEYQRTVIRHAVNLM